MCSSPTVGNTNETKNEGECLKWTPSLLLYLTIFFATIKDEQLANLVVSLHEDSLLSIKHEEKQVKDSQIICSLGLF